MSVVGKKGVKAKGLGCNGYVVDGVQGDKPLPNEMQVELFPKQLQFLESTEKEVLFSGGVRSGKSVALCWALFREAAKPKNECILIRKTYKSLKLSTIVTLLGGSNPVIPHGCYKLNKTEGVVYVNGGGSIYLLGMDEPSRIRSINAGCICIDESSEFTEDEYLELTYRLANPIGCRQMFMATNPASPSHWLYERFFTHNLPGYEDRKVITVASYENDTLPKDYIEKTLGNLDPVLRKRFVEGLWIQMEGLVYSNFLRTNHVRKLEECVYDEYYLGIDFGQTHPSAILLCGLKYGKLYVIEEYCKSDPSIEKLRTFISRQYEKYKGNLTMVYDPSAKIIFNAMNDVGITMIPADNKVGGIGGGIMRVRTKLNNGEDGTPNLIVNDDCVNTIREFESYQYKDGSEVVKKINDDCLDALRYIVNEIEDNKAGYIYPQIVGNDEKEETNELDDDLLWTDSNRDRV